MRPKNYIVRVNTIPRMRKYNDKTPQPLENTGKQPF